MHIAGYGPQEKNPADAKRVRLLKYCGRPRSRSIANLTIGPGQGRRAIERFRITDAGRERSKLAYHESDPTRIALVVIGRYCRASPSRRRPKPSQWTSRFAWPAGGVAAL